MYSRRGTILPVITLVLYCGPALLSNMTLVKFTKEAQLPNLIYITATYLQVLQFRSKNIPITYYKLGFEQYQNTRVYYITWKVLNTITRRILDIEYWQSKLIKAILHIIYVCTRTYLLNTISAHDLTIMDQINRNFLIFEFYEEKKLIKFKTRI